MNGPSPIRTAFNRAHAYDQQAMIQARIAEKLALGLAQVPPKEKLHGLELGCGTGFLSRLWLEQLPHTHLLLSDIAPAMVLRTQANLQSYPQNTLKFAVMDAEAPCLNTTFDLIAASMVFQWFHHPAASVANLLNLLAPSGRLLFATLGPDTFQEWRSLCENHRIPCGLHHYPGADFWFDLATKQKMSLELSEEHIPETYPSTLDFLKRLKAIGAETPAPNHQPAPAGKLRRLLVPPGGIPTPLTVTHHVFFGTFINHRKTGKP
ncbi:MAG: methyltransferase [Magnetococcus sp. THC-1_WYH]